MSAPIRVLVVEDSAFMRRALVKRIEADPRFQVAETAENGLEGVEKALRVRPDVITLDVEMPVMNGVEALKQIVSRTSIPVVMLSAVTLDGAKVTLEALEIGAVDFIPKANGAELIHEKLLAAVGANVRSRGRAFPLPMAREARCEVHPRAERGHQLNAKIVVIGSSTGGPQALFQVVKELPETLSVPVVVAQHMPAQFTLALAKRLDECSAVRVVEARDGERLCPGVVYVAPGGSHLRVSATGVHVGPDKGESLYRPSVDVLAESARTHFGRQVLGVMLTGMGNDGAQEFLRLKQAGGYTLAQDQASSVVFGMPKSVIEIGAASEVVPLDRIGTRMRALLGC